MATVVRTKLSTIVKAIRDRLVTKGLADAARVLVTSPGRPLEPVPDYGNNYVQVQPDSQTTQEPVYAGAGRHDTRVTRTLMVITWTRLDVDEPHEDESWLLDASLGHLDQEHNVFEALVGWMPVDNNQNVLVSEPIKLAPVSAPEKKGTDGWGHSVVGLSVSFVLDITPTEPIE